ncbi:MFS transporter [Thermoleophilia bacterium SCSIO 60948]|nr:MFS transporter [Thermoleophilia bacterium SCSIO 60948]
MPSTGSTSPERPAPMPRAVLMVVLLAGVSFALSQTLVIPALAPITESFGASDTASSWVLTGFLLSASVATPIVGKLGDLYGKGRTLAIVLSIFALGSVVCAFAESIGPLIAGRVMCGVAGGVFPLSFGIIRDNFPPERVPAGLGLMSAIFGIGGGIGLPLSGVIVDNFDISWLFWIGLVALPAAFAAFRLVPPSPTRSDVKIDWGGAVLLSIGLAAVLLGVTESNDWGWDSLRTIGLIVGGVLVLAGWLRYEDRHPEPLIDLAVLSERPVWATNLVGFLIGFAMFSSFLLLPRFAQTPEIAGYGFGFSVTASGLLLLPGAISQLITGPFAGTLGVRFGFRATLAGGAALATAAFIWAMLLHDEPWQLVISGILLSVGIAFAFASMANLIVAAVDQSTVGIATGINTVTRTVGGAFGSAVATSVLAANVIEGTPLPAEAGYTTAFAISSVGGIAALGAAMLIPRTTGRRAARAEGAAGSPRGGPEPEPAHQPSR